MGRSSHKQLILLLQHYWSAFNTCSVDSSKSLALISETWFFCWVLKSTMDWRSERSIFESLMPSKFIEYSYVLYNCNRYWLGRQRRINHRRIREDFMNLVSLAIAVPRTPKLSTFLFLVLNTCKPVMILFPLSCYLPGSECKLWRRTAARVLQ